MPSDPDARAAKSEQTRARLLEGAMTAFSELGFHGTSTRHIATAAGMSPAAVYVHYDSKEELLFRISLQGHREILEIVRVAAASSDDPVTQLHTVARDFAIYHARHHVSARVVNYELASLNADHLAEIVALRAQIDDVVTRVLADGMAAGVFSTPDPRMAAVAMIGSGIDVARWFRDGRSWSPHDVGAFYGDAALRLVGATADSPETPATPSPEP